LLLLYSIMDFAGVNRLSRYCAGESVDMAALEEGDVGFA